MIGGVVASSANNFIYAGMGGTSATGPGDSLWVGVAQGRATLCQAQVSQPACQSVFVTRLGPAWEDRLV